MRRRLRALATAIRDWWWAPQIAATARSTDRICRAVGELTHVLDHTNYSLSAFHTDASWETEVSSAE